MENIEVLLAALCPPGMEATMPPGEMAIDED
jgi:hypothetical protein